MRKKTNNVKIFMLVIIVSIISLVILSVSTIENNKREQLAKPNYLGLAKLGLIPSKQTCSHPQELYFSTGVIGIDGEGSRFLILMSKLGDESCLARVG